MARGKGVAVGRIGQWGQKEGVLGGDRSPMQCADDALLVFFFLNLFFIVILLVFF